MNCEGKTHFHELNSIVKACVVTSALQSYEVTLWVCVCVGWIWRESGKMCRCVCVVRSERNWRKRLQQIQQTVWNRRSSMRCLTFVNLRGANCYSRCILSLLSLIWSYQL